MERGTLKSQSREQLTVKRKRVAVNYVTRKYNKVGFCMRNQRAYVISAHYIKFFRSPRADFVSSYSVGVSALKGIYYLRVGKLQNFDFCVLSVL